MIDEQVRQLLAALTARAAQCSHRRVVQLEARQLPDRLLVDDELRSVPEDRAVREHPGQRQQERDLELVGHVLVRHVLDTVGLVDDLEEQPDVAEERVPPGVLQDLLQAVGELLAVAASTGADVAVQHSDRLGEGGGRDELAPLHRLLPGDSSVHDEGVLALDGRQVVEHLHDLDVVAHVPQRHVAVQLGLADVQHVEPPALPVEVGVQVNGDTDPGPHLGLVLDQADAGRDTLQTVDDERLLLQVEHVVTCDDVVLAPSHADLDVRNTPRTERLHELADLGLAELFALVVVHLEKLQRLGVDETLHDDAARIQVQRCVFDLDARPAHGTTSFRLRVTIDMVLW